MTRTATAKRLLIGIPYIIVYIAILFPVTLTTAIVLGVADALVRLVIGRPTILTVWSRTLWDWIGGNARWALTGSGSFSLTP